MGIADVLNPQPKVQAAFPKPVELKAPSHFAKKRVACASYNVPDDELRSRALNRFRVLVSLDLHATQIGTSNVELSWKPRYKYRCVASLIRCSC